MKITRKSFQSFFTRASFAGLLLGGAAATQAQTNGNLTGTVSAYNYSTAPWVITGGTGAYPDGGGVATFNPITGVTPGTVGPVSTVTFDVSPTLSQINFTSPIQYILATGTGQSIVASSSGLTLNAQGTAQNITVNGQPQSIAFGSQITGAITGGGTAGLTKTGTGNLYLIGNAGSTYTGGTHFNGGFTTVGGTAAVGDTVFGATGAGNGLSFNGGSVLFNTTGGLTTARDIFIDAGGGTLLANTATTLTGNISGSGTLTNIGFGGTALTLQGANTFTGAFVARASNAITTLSGNGSLASAASYDVMGTVNLDNSGTNVTNRLSDTAAVTLRGGNIIFTGNASAASSETIGAVTATNGFNTVLVTPGTGQTSTLTVTSLTRQNNATFDFRGAGLGSAPGTAGTSNIFLTNPPAGALVGGGGGAGTTSISIIPFAIGNSGTTTTLTAAGQIGSSFVTYDVNGIRPLATTEYATTLGVSPTDNVRITAVTAAPAASVVNSLLVAPSVASTAAAPVLTGGPITVTSGAVLYSPTANVTGFIGANLNFGTAEGIITNTSLLTVSGVITGTNGLTLSTAYAPSTNYTPNLNLTGANTYAGNTTINSGTIGVSGTVGGTSGAFGTNGTVILNGGVILASIAPTATTTFNNNISSIGFGQNYISPSTSGFVSTFNGNISLSNNLNIEGFTNAAASGLVFNGVISGTGTLTDIGFTNATLNGNNTYSGGTILGGSTASTYLAGTDTAFGTGTITFNNSSTAGSSIAGVGTTARTFANNLFLNATSGFAGTAPMTFNGTVNLNGSRTMNVSNTALTTFNGVVSSGSLTKTGTGAVAFNSATGSTYTGGFVNTGLAATSSAIYANNTSGSAFGTGAVSVGGASATVYSTLAGSFTTSGAVSIGGRLSPGYTPANLTAATAGIGAIGTTSFNTTLTLSSATTSSLYLEAASNVNHDQINVGGLFTLNGTVYIATTGGYSFSSGTVIDFADWGSIAVGTVTFNTASATVDPGYQLDTSFFTTDGTIRVTAVPEPGTWAVVALGLGALGGMQFARRRRS